MKTRLAHLAVWLWLPVAAAAGTGPFSDEMLERLRQITQKLYSLDYDEAARLCREMIAQDPDNPAGYVYLAKTSWLEMLNKEQVLGIDRFASSDFFAEKPKGSADSPPPAGPFAEASERAIQKAKARVAARRDDRAAQYLLGVAFQDRASLEISMRRNWWAGVRFGSTSYRIHRELLAKEADFADPYLVTGVYNYVAGSVRWNLKWLAYILGYSGNRERGKAELEMAASKAILAADDARAVLALIYTREKQHQKALDKLAELHRKYPRNYLAHLDMAGLRIRMGQPAQAIAAYEEVLGKIGERVDGYERLEAATVENRIGVARRVSGDLTAAVDRFRKVLDAADSSDRTKTVARLELGKTLDLLGRREEAVAQYRAVQAAADYAGSRLEAERFLHRKYQPEAR